MTIAENRTYDVDLELHDGTVKTASFTGSGGIIDLGSATAKAVFDVMVRYSGLLISDNDELYRVILEGSTKSDFADTIVNLALAELGANEVLNENVDQDSPAAGALVLSATNKLIGTVYRYARLRVTISGTTASITAYAALHKRGD
jgi:hypothetical protein